MSQERVERLEALLSRVQENRNRPRTRTPAGLGAAPQVAKAAEAPKAAPVREPQAAAPRPAPVMQKPVVRTIPPAPPTPSGKAIAQPPAARAAAPEPGPASQPARRPGQDRSATPLEMAVAELDLASAAASNKAEVRREPAAPAAPAVAPAIAPEEAFEPYVIEPEPIREPARPIAQVVSRHAPQVDATFGAMLKRSLSLRPH